VHVGVDEPRQEVEARAVDPLRRLDVLQPADGLDGSVVHGEVSPVTRANAATVDLSERVTSHTTRSSKSDVNRAPGRANGTASVTTPWAGHASRRRRILSRQGRPPRSRCLDDESTSRRSYRWAVVNWHAVQASNRRRNATSTTTDPPPPGPPRSTPVTRTPGRSRTRFSKVVARTGGSRIGDCRSSRPYEPPVPLTPTAPPSYPGHSRPHPTHSYGRRANNCITDDWKAMNTLERAWSEVRAEAELLSKMSAFPIWTNGGSWVTVELDQNERGVLPHHGSWMVGDLPAILWFLATEGADDNERSNWAKRALQWSERLANRTGLKSFASVAHMFFRGTLVGMAIGHEEQLRPLAMAAAKTVSERFLEIGYMKSFGTPADTQYPFTTVDDVINLAVPLWYAQHANNEELSSAAMAAVHLIADRLVRPNGSTGQVLLFDQGGNPDGIDTYQGYSPEGCWSRGQAWGIYGFATVYRLTGDPVSLQLAERMTDYWIDRVQDEPAPLYDFDLPEDEKPIRDTFAASLAYAGILELAELSDTHRRSELRTYATRMLEALSLKHVIGNPRGHGILSGAALDVPHDHGIDASVIVGDSYYTEAVWRLLAGATHTESPRMFPQ